MPTNTSTNTPTTIHYRKGQKVRIPSLKMTGKIMMDGSDKALTDKNDTSGSSSGNLMYMVMLNNSLSGVVDMRWYYPDEIEPMGKKS